MLGSLPIEGPLQDDQFIIFAARCWQIVDIDEKAWVELVKPAPAGKAPPFTRNTPFGVRREIRQKMRYLYEG